MNRRSFSLALVGLLSCFFVAGGAAAKDKKWNIPKGRGQQAVVEEVNVAGRTVTLGGKVYGVPSSARLVDATGKRIRLGQLTGVGSSKSADFVEFWTRQNGRGGDPEITRLSVKPGMSF